MNAFKGMLFGALLCLPVLGMAQDSGSSPQAASSMASASETPRTSVRPVFDLRNTRVQSVIRANARAASAPSQAQTGQNLPADTTPAASAIEQQGIAFRAPRRMHHMDCGLSDCVAYNADGDALFTVPREQYVGTHANNAADEWLSCQSGNDLLTTSERYDKCRGVGIGLPLQFHDVIVKLPLIH
jgi:hypothetical protein